MNRPDPSRPETPRPSARTGPSHPNLAAIAQARERVAGEFPFPGYIANAVDAIPTIAGTVARLLAPPAKILDFGSGPCDKTAVLQYLGYRCTAVDDLADDWHLAGDNRARILAFAERCGIDFALAAGALPPFAPNGFDMVMLHDVLEHLHDSPRELLNDLIECVRPNGYLFVTVPNAVNLRKRLDVLRGRTNLPPFPSYYWYPGPWRGHIREYVERDLRELVGYLGLEPVELCGCHHMLRRLPPLWRGLYPLLARPFPGLCDTWSLVARKPVDWRPRRSLPLAD
jgi:SAM-dependent methyltransferase